MRTVILQNIATWQFSARPNPSREDASKAFGIHLEEVHEMLEAIEVDADHAHLRADISTLLHALAEGLKSGNIEVESMDRKEVLDSLCDQIVSAVGVGHTNRMDVIEGTYRTDRSNWSKFDADGRPIFNANGKVIKGPHFKPVDLGGLY